MEYFVDMHNHIVPGVDDGSQSLEESLALLDMEYKEGARKIICTPHYIRGRNSYSYGELDARFSELQAAAKEKYPELQLYLGNEVLYEAGIADDLRAGMIHTMAGTKYVLIEFNIRIPYNELYKGMQEVTATRKRIIIAHVERYHCLEGRMDRMQELAEMGLLFQMNTEAVEGSLFDESTRWRRKLLRSGIISFLSTDCHDTENRTPDWSDAVKWIRKKCGDNAVSRLCRENAEVVLENRILTGQAL